MRVLRVSHSDVVSGWRERDRLLRALGVDLDLACARAWQEGGALVALEREPDDDGTGEWVKGVRTFGEHPNLFLFDPRPLWRMLRQCQWDLVDLHEEPFSLVAAEVLLLLAIVRRRTPMVVYSAQNLDKRYPFPFSWIERTVLRKAGGAYPCSAAAGARLRARGFAGVLEVLPLGVKLERFQAIDRPIPSAPLRVGFLGRLAPEKGVDDLLRAFRPLDGWTLEMVGDGPARGELEQQIRSLGLQDRVRLVGHVDQASLPGRYRSFDAVVIPSVPTPSWTEQFCRVAVEAMATGTPVIASDAGALPEVVGDAGLLVPAGDVDALRQALQRLGHDPGLWGDLRERGLARAATFTWSSVAAAQLGLYQRVLGTA